MAKYTYTTIAGVDVMMGEIVEQREYEIYLESGNNNVADLKRYFNSINSKEKKASIQEMMAGS